METEISNLVTENRFNNLISKVGRLKKLNKKKEYLLKLDVEDVVESWQDKDVFVLLNDHQKKQATDMIISKSTQLLEQLLN